MARPERVVDRLREGQAQGRGGGQLGARRRAGDQGGAAARREPGQALGAAEPLPRACRARNGQRAGHRVTGNRYRARPARDVTNGCVARGAVRDGVDGLVERDPQRRAARHGEPVVAQVRRRRGQRESLALLGAEQPRRGAGPAHHDPDGHALAGSDHARARREAPVAERGRYRTPVGPEHRRGLDLAAEEPDLHARECVGIRGKLHAGAEVHGGRDPGGQRRQAAGHDPAAAPRGGAAHASVRDGELEQSRLPRPVTIGTRRLGGYGSLAAAGGRRLAGLHVRRPVGVEALHGLHAPGLALRALGLGPDGGLGVRVVGEVAAGGHLDAVAAGLEAVEEEALGDRVLGGRGLDRHVVVEEQVGGAQHLLARVHPEGEVVEAARARWASAT